VTARDRTPDDDLLPTRADASKGLAPSPDSSAATPRRSVTDPLLEAIQRFRVQLRRSIAMLCVVWVASAVLVAGAIVFASHPSIISGAAPDPTRPMTQNHMVPEPIPNSGQDGAGSAGGRPHAGVLGAQKY
jgi:hypothetical protein